jgi:hypothetical protein
MSGIASSQYAISMGTGSSPALRSHLRPFRDLPEASAPDELAVPLFGFAHRVEPYVGK